MKKDIYGDDGTITKYFDSNVIVHNDKKLNEILNKNIITVRVASDYTLKETGVYEELSLSPFTSIGDKLSLKNNSINLFDVSKVLVSYMITFVPKTTGLKYAQVFVNDAATVANRITGTNGENIQIIQPPIMLNVSKGSTLKFKAFGSANDIILGGRALVTVEVIE